jgi:hypothetical protein
VFNRQRTSAGQLLAVLMVLLLGWTQTACTAGPLATKLAALTTALEDLVAIIPQVPASAQADVKTVGNSIATFATCISTAALNSAVNDTSAVAACAKGLPVLSTLSPTVQGYVSEALGIAQAIAALFPLFTALARPTAAPATSKPMLPLSAHDKAIVTALAPRLAAAQAAVR